MMENETDISNIAAYFMTHIAPGSSRHPGTKPAKNKRLKAVVTHLCLKGLGREGPVMGFMLYGIKKEGFYHGAFAVDNRSGAVIYFEQLDKGLMILAPPPDSYMTGNTDYFRFSILGERSTPIVMSPRSTSVH